MPRSRRAEPTGFREHLAFFDEDLDERISLSETRRGLERLGFGHLLALPGSVAINVGVMGLGMLRGSVVNPVELDLSRTALVRHPDTAIIDAEGNFSEAVLEAQFVRHGRTFAGEAMTVPEIVAMLGDRVVRAGGKNRMGLLLLPLGLGAVALEWGALVWVAGKRRDGRLVLTQAAVRRFYTDPRFFHHVAKRSSAQRRVRRRTVLGTLRNALQEWVL